MLATTALEECKSWVSLFIKSSPWLYLAALALPLAKNVACNFLACALLGFIFALIIRFIAACS